MSCADRVGAFIDAELVNPTIKGTVTLDKTAASTIYDGIKEFADAGLSQSIKEGLEAALEKGISTSKLEVTGDVKVTDAVLNKWATEMKDTILENVEEKLKGAVLENVKLDEESVKHVVKVMTDQKFYTEFVDGIMEEVAKDAESLFEELKLHEVDIFSPKIDGGEITKAKAEGLTSNDTTLTGTTTVSGEVIMDDAVLTILLKQLTDRLGFDHLTNTAGNKFNGQGIATKCDIDALREMLIERTTLYDCHGNPHGPQAQFMDCATVNELVNDKVDGLESKLKEEGVPGRVFDCAGNLHPLNAGFMNCDQTKAAIKEMGDTKADAEETKKKFGNLQDVADDHEGRIGKLEETSGWKLKGSDGKPLAKDSSLYTKEEIDLMQGGEGSEVGAELIKRVETLEGKTPHGCDGNELAPKTGLVTCNQFDKKVGELEDAIKNTPAGGTTVHGCDDKPLADGTKVITCDEHAEFAEEVGKNIADVEKSIEDGLKGKQDRLLGCDGVELAGGATVPTCAEVKSWIADSSTGALLNCDGSPHPEGARFYDCEGTRNAIDEAIKLAGIDRPDWGTETPVSDEGGWFAVPQRAKDGVFQVTSLPEIKDTENGAAVVVVESIPESVEDAEPVLEWRNDDEPPRVFQPAGKPLWIGVIYSNEETGEDELVKGSISIQYLENADTVELQDCKGNALTGKVSVATCADLSEAIDKLKKELSDRIAALENTVKGHDSRIASNKKEIDGLKGRVTALEAGGGGTGGGSGNHGPIEEHTTTDEAMWYDLGISDKDRYLVVDAVDPNKPHNSRKWGVIVEKTLTDAPDNSAFDETWNFVGAKYEWDANTNSALLKLDANKPYIISSIIKPDSNVGAKRMLSAATFRFHYVDFTGEEKPTLKDCSGKALPDGASVATCADMNNAISPVKSTAANADKVAKEAKAAADSANTKATDAAAKATTADTKATDAATKADAAKSAADVAQAAATNAAQEASKASTAANEAKGEAADAIAQVGELEARVAQNTEKVGEAAKTAGDAKDEVEALEPRVKALEDAEGNTGGVTLPIDGGDVRMGANAIFDDAIVPEELAWEGHRVNITDVAKRGPFVIAAHGGLPDVGLPLQVVTYDRYTGYEMKHPLTILGHQAYFDGGDFAGIFFDDSDTYLEAPEDWDVSLTRISVLSGVTATEALGIVASQALSAGHAAINGGGGGTGGGVATGTNMFHVAAEWPQTEANPPIEDDDRYEVYEYTTDSTTVAGRPYEVRTFDITTAIAERGRYPIVAVHPVVLTVGTGNDTYFKVVGVQQRTGDVYELGAGTIAEDWALINPDYIRPGDTVEVRSYTPLNSGAQEGVTAYGVRGQESVGAALEGLVIKTASNSIAINDLRAGLPPGAQEVEVPKDVQDLAYTPVRGRFDSGDYIELDKSEETLRTLSNGYKNRSYRLWNHLEKFYDEPEESRPAAVWVTTWASMPKTATGEPRGGWMTIYDDSDPHSVPTYGSATFPGRIRIALEPGSKEEARGRFENLVLSVATPPELSTSNEQYAIIAVREVGDDMWHYASALSELHAQLTGDEYTLSYHNPPLP